MKVFLSVGMSHRKDEDIIFDVERASSIIRHMFGDSVEIIHNWNCPKAPKKSGCLWYLGEAIKKLGKCDACFFVSGWEKHKGCKVEQFICSTYNIKEIYEDERLTPEKPSSRRPSKEDGLLMKRQVRDGKYPQCLFTDEFKEIYAEKGK